MREDAGMAKEGLAEGAEPAERLQEERKEDDKSLIDKARDKLEGS